MKRFEYYKDFDLSTKELNQLGLESWELISTFVSKYNTFYYIFKRELIN